jgi:predicted DNA-binding transcriptional regulator AlpA
MPEFIKLADLKAAGIGFSNAYLKRLEATNQFPRRIQFSPRKPVWLKSDIEKYVADKIAESRKE